MQPVHVDHDWCLWNCFWDPRAVAPAARKHNWVRQLYQTSVMEYLTTYLLLSILYIRFSVAQACTLWDPGLFPIAVIP